MLIFQHRQKKYKHNNFVRTDKYNFLFKKLKTKFKNFIQTKNLFNFKIIFSNNFLFYLLARVFKTTILLLRVQNDLGRYSRDYKILCLIKREKEGNFNRRKEIYYYIFHHSNI